MAAAFGNVRGSFWWGLCVLGGLISLYGWLAKGGRDAKRYEIGDNCYFIGFVYTLVVISLSVGLDARELLYSPPEGGGSSAGLQHLLETVGVALGTSVIGMLWRFGLVHNIQIPENEFERMVERTAVAANKLEAAVSVAGKSAANANDSLRAVAGAAQIYADKMLLETEKIGEHMTEVAGKIFDDFGNRIADTLQKTQFDSVREDLQDAVDEHRAATAEISALIKQSAAALEDASKTAAAVSDAAQQSLQSAADGNEWGKIGDAAAGFAAQIETMGGGLRRIAEQQTALAESAESDIARLRESRAAFDSLMRDLRADIAAAAQIKEQYRQEFDKAAKEALAETHRLYARLIAGAEVALAQNGELKSLAGSMQKIAARLEKPKK